MANIQGNEYNIILNDISPDIYEAAKEIWNTAYGSPADGIAFLDFCAQQWFRIKPLFHRAVRDGVPEAFLLVYRYYRDMTIVGAQTELERNRGRWLMSNPHAVIFMTHIRALRIAVSASYGPEPLVNDTQEEYFRQIQQQIVEAHTEDENEAQTEDELA